MGTDSEEPVDTTPDLPSNPQADGPSEVRLPEEETPHPPADLAQPADPAVPRPVEEVDDLAALAFAAQEAMPPLPIHRRVGIEARAGAAILDGAFYVASYFIFAVLYHCAGGQADQLLFLLFLVGWLAYTAAEVFYSATIGKAILGIRIANADFGPSTRHQRLLRWLVRRSPDLLITFLCGLATAEMMNVVPPIMNAIAGPGILMALAWWIVVFIWFMFCAGRSRQALYDRFFGTAVIQDMDQKSDIHGGFGVVTPPAPALPPDSQNV